MRIRSGQKVRVFGAVYNYDWRTDGATLGMQYEKNIWTVISTTRYLAIIELIDEDLDRPIRGIIHKKQISSIVKPNKKKARYST